MKTDVQRFMFGTGMIIDGEVNLRPGAVIRPASLAGDAVYLQKRAADQRVLGMLYALHESITFEFQISASSDQAAAIDIWNAQWDLIFLSIIARHPVYWPFGSVGDCSDNDKSIFLNNLVFSRWAYHPAKKMQQNHWQTYAELIVNFKNLLNDQRFIHATSVAATHYNIMNGSVRMAAIWSAIEALLGFDHELSFRISSAVAVLLEKDAENRKRRFRQIKKLYNIRSRSVHGGKIENEKANAAADQSHQVLCELLIDFIRRGRLLNPEEAEVLLLGT
ncbi:hypothetical protein [Ferrovibrio sp.]|uniref:hypothetical protein n=1 Tax=Ferrovibrio sp. TaxID=1917215 RepID=UPI003D12B3CA